MGATENAPRTTGVISVESASLSRVIKETKFLEQIFEQLQCSEGILSRGSIGYWLHLRRIDQQEARCRVITRLAEDRAIWPHGLGGDDSSHGWKLPFSSAGKDGGCYVMRWVVIEPCVLAPVEAIPIRHAAQHVAHVGLIDRRKLGGRGLSATE